MIIDDDKVDYIDELVALIDIDQVDCLDVWYISVDVSDNLYLNLKKMFIYIKNNMIIMCSKDWTLKIWKPYKVELEWYYKVKDWKPYMITTEQELPWAFFVWDRNREEFYRKRQLCVEWTKEEEELRNHIEENRKKWLDQFWNPLKEENEEENDENPTPENHSESEE